MTVTFNCIPGAAPIQTCPSPVTVSTEGANQVVSGTVVDTANNTASASDTVNLDLTPPVVTITSPANNSSVGTSYVIVTGTITDALSGLGSVNCNVVPATLTGTNFSCTLQLSSVSNQITVTGSDLAGNTASASLTVNVSMAPPTSLTITPGPANMIVGQTQAFTAVDQTGLSRPDATWSVSDTTIASFVSGSPNTLMGDAAGQVTLTAMIGSISAQTQVTVLTGAPAIGTVLWSAPAIPGYTTQQIVQAVPTTNGPDIYALDADANGDVVVQALKSDGEQLWQTSSLPIEYQTGYTGVGDNSGGLIMTGYSSPSALSDEVIDVNPQTGALNWSYTAAATGTYYGNAPAVGLDGKVYVIENDEPSPPYYQNLYADLDVIDGSTGVLVSQTQLPQAIETYSCPFNDTTQGSYGMPTVGPDGSVFLEVEGYDEAYNCAGSPTLVSYSETLSLLTFPPGGAQAQYQTLGSFSTSDIQPGETVYGPFHIAGDIIPDGASGMLATWETIPANGVPALTPPTVADIGPQGTVQATFSNLNLWPYPAFLATIWFSVTTEQPSSLTEPTSCPLMSRTFSRTGYTRPRVVMS